MWNEPIYQFSNDDADIDCYVRSNANPYTLLVDDKVCSNCDYDNSKMDEITSP